MTPIDDLINEHKAVVVALDILRKLSTVVDGGSVRAQADLVELLDFFSEFVDRCHHAKEEEALFPELARAQSSEAQELIRLMLSEHERGRTHLRALAEQLQRLRDGDTSATTLLTHHANAYCDLLFAHIAKENDVLFAKAIKLIPTSAAKSLREQFDRIENERIGRGKHEQYRAMLQRLNASYAT